MFFLRGRGILNIKMLLPPVFTGGAFSLTTRARYFSPLQLKVAMKHILITLFTFFFILSVSTPAISEERPVWWKQLTDEAHRDGYTLITLDDLKRLYDSKAQFLIVDARTEYEYRDGHLPDAVNFDFDPGDKLQLKPEKKSAFLKLLGPDKNRKIIIYCRGFR
jgi:rhodanese-related sulfurtransferase